MTREGAIDKLIRIRQQQGDKSEAHEALGMAIDALAYQAELPDGLEEAACEYVEELEKKMKAETGSNFDEDVAYLLTRLFIAGAERTKEQMMKNAFHCEIIKSRTHIPHLKPYFFSSDFGKIGDKVKVIVIPEE